MSIWVKDCNDTLSLYTRFYITKRDTCGNQYIVVGISDGDKYELGSYEKKDRALEVIGEIEDFISLNAQSPSEYPVFQMPKE